MYILKDSHNKIVAKFKTLKAAKEYNLYNGRINWTIEEEFCNNSNSKQRSAVAFCLAMIPNIRFHGDTSDFKDCTEFLYKNLDKAITIAQMLNTNEWDAEDECPIE